MSGLYRGYVGIMETTIVYWGYGTLLKFAVAGLMSLTHNKEDCFKMLP